MGEFTSWVSQFYVSDLYTQINYNNQTNNYNDTQNKKKLRELSPSVQLP